VTVRREYWGGGTLDSPQHLTNSSARACDALLGGARARLRRGQLTQVWDTQTWVLSAVSGCYAPWGYRFATVIATAWSQWGHARRAWLCGRFRSF